MHAVNIAIHDRRAGLGAAVGARWQIGAHAALVDQRNHRAAGVAARRSGKLGVADQTG